MAGYYGATARIAALLGHGESRTTPGTISAYQDRDWGRVIQSYELPIALSSGDGDVLIVKTNLDNSLTTNRHIQAAHNFATRGYPSGYRQEGIKGLGFIKTGHTQWNGDTFTVYERPEYYASRW